MCGAGVTAVVSSALPVVAAVGTGRAEVGWTVVLLCVDSVECVCLAN